MRARLSRRAARKGQAMKKTITLSDDQVDELVVSIRLDIKRMNQFMQFDLENGDMEDAAKWEARIRRLDQVDQKIRRAKWKS